MQIGRGQEFSSESGKTILSFHTLSSLELAAGAQASTGGNALRRMPSSKNGCDRITLSRRSEPNLFCFFNSIERAVVAGVDWTQLNGLKWESTRDTTS